MLDKNVLIKRARQLTVQNRMAALMSMQETKLHKNLAKLFSEMDKDATVQITHSSTELGADLLVIRNDAFRESIASVVVSMRHLRGETGQQIERILSQVKQCVDIPRETRTRVDLALTTEIWLVIAGEVSTNARKRLNYQVRTEYKAAITIFNIEWLVKQFTQYYPEVFLGGDVLSFVEERIQRLELISPLSKRAENLNLSEWYIEPYLSTGGIPIELDDAGKKLTIKTQKVRFRTLQSIMSREKKLIISGDPGVGKTTALSKFVLDMLREISDSIVGGRCKEPISIPVIISARSLLECNDCESLFKMCVDKEEIREGFTISTIVVDGLDEVTFESRNEVLNRATRFCTDIDCNLIVGTRKVDVIKNPPQGVSTFELMPFEISQALKLFEKLVKGDQILLNTLKDGLSKVRTQLPMTPIALILLIEIAEEHREVPASLCDLYNRYFEMVLGKWDLRDKGVESLFQYETKIHFLSELAWVQFHKNDKVEIKKDEFDSFVKEYVVKFGFNPDSIDQFVVEVERAGLLELKDLVSFRHRSYLDYFAALYVFRKQDEIGNIDELITKLHFNDLWGDIAFFYVGIRKALTQKILESISNFSGDDLGIHISKLLIGRLLQAGWLSTHEIKCIGIKLALENLLPIRKQLRKSFEESPQSLGFILADFFPMAIAEWSMGSITLVNPLKDTLRDLPKEASKESVWKSLALVWTLWRFLSAEEKEESISGLLTDVSDSQVLDSEEKSALLLVMIAIEDKTRVMKAAIDKRLRRLGKQNPELFKKLLPPFKDGFRRKPRKRA